MPQFRNRETLGEITNMDKRNAIVNFITQELAVGNGDVELGYEDDLLLSGLVSSLDIMRLVAFVEAEYGITIPAEDIVIEHFETVDAIHNYVSA